MDNQNVLPLAMDAVLAAYDFPESVLGVVRYGQGHINDTFCVVCQPQEGDCIRFILQGLSSVAFPHPEELMELLSVFTGDSSYEKVIPEILERKKKGEVITMCTVAQGLMEKGRTEQITKDILISISRYRKLGLDNETIRNIIIEDYQLDEKEIDTFLGK